MGDEKDKIISTARKRRTPVERHSTLLDMSALASRPALDAIRELQENSSIQRMLKEIKHSPRITAWPLENLRLASESLDRTSLFGRELETTRLAMAEFHARFSLPEMSEVARLMKQFQTSPMVEVLKRYEEQTSSFKHAMERMRTPWLDIHESLRSISGFAALQGIGNALQHMPAFGSNLSVALRVDLGDWRIRSPGRRRYLLISRPARNFMRDSALILRSRPFRHRRLRQASISRSCGVNRRSWKLMVPLFRFRAMTPRKKASPAQTRRITGCYVWRRRCDVLSTSR